ncbi:MAG: leucine-rich repeat protein [Candidatus Lokiarchaeota archaeon]|nr:leucine-rich repeat protein [Candidatus Lokiarchaeota archaeon]
MVTIKKQYKINIVGEPGVGKSLFFKRLGNKEFNPILTIGAYVIKKEVLKQGTMYQFLVFDQDKPKKWNIDQFILSNTDGIIFMYDITDRSSLETFDKWLKIIEKNIDKHVPIVLFGNKNDLEHQREVDTSMVNEIKESHYLWKGFEGSAKTGKNIEETFFALSELLLDESLYQQYLDGFKIFDQMKMPFAGKTSVEDQDELARGSKTHAIKKETKLDSSIKIESSTKKNDKMIEECSADPEASGVYDNRTRRQEENDFITFNKKKFYLLNNGFFLTKHNIGSVLDLTELFKFAKLGGLYLQDNEISTFEGIERFPELDALYLSNNKIQGISGLENNKKLIDLKIDENQIERIEGLSTLDNLERLDLSRNQIKKIENLDNLTNLKDLHLSSNNISRIENLDHLENLTSLGLSGNPISKIEGLDSLKELKTLGMQGTSINKIEGLSTLKKLKSLFLDSHGDMCKLTELEGLERLSSLIFLRINFLDKETNTIIELEDVIIARFVCMVKTGDYRSMEDWKGVFKKFPLAFLDYINKYSLKNSGHWIIRQSTSRLLEVIKKIMEDPEYIEIKRARQSFWKDFQIEANVVFIDNQIPSQLQKRDNWI